MMRKLLRLTLAALAAVLTLSVVSCNKEPVPADKWKDHKAKYTIRFYGCGGTNVDSQLEAGLQRKDAKGKLVVPEHQSYSVGVSLYSPVKDEPYQKYASVYKASAFDAATQWSKFLNVNQISVMGEDAMNPCNDSSWELFWLDD